MRVVVVGATGNVGLGVLRRLQREAGVEIVGVARRVPAPDAPAPYAGVFWHAIDVAADRAVRDLTLAFSGADAVISLAWLLQPNHDERVLAATNVGGLRHVLQAVAAAGVPQVLVASSVGAYSQGPKRRRVDETWPTGSIASSHYGRHKARIERMMDVFERDHPDVVVTRMRPGLVMNRRAGADLIRLFVGPLVPVRWLTRVPLPVLPMPPRAVSQVVHVDDLGDAFWRAVDRRAGGAFNVAAEPVVGPDEVAEVLGARWVPMRIAPVRGAIWLAWQLHLIRLDPGWLDIATSVPVMSTERARAELGWAPTVDAIDALREAIRGVADHEVEAASPHLGRRPRPPMAQ
ncbi:NAD-dependent epimerase/dehydratase family protein [Amnibacterium sp.]|uniref:NAD-dependent epimerase/dehydratase family protein n=1 Tax=Amnibacterium sp. TaxID=1872496 RepID=UPI00261C5B05|nr:NAD-dependent epimerase/dehydratase family protein [Amnibacterium sp.]MCU1473128.1 epimerase [Amnibacterium sp.]